MPAWLIPAIQAAAAIGSQIMQNKANKKQAEWAYGKDKLSTDIAYQRELELMKYQNTYNSPLAQMQRFKDAGLNPNLVYGQGSPGNMQSTPRVPQQAPAKAAQVSMQIPDVAGMYQDARLKAAQTDLINEKTEESTIKQDLMKVQKAVAAANPYLAPGYLDSVVAQMKAIADIKKQEATFKLEEVTGVVTGPGGTSTQGMGYTKGWLMMQTQMQSLLQKYDLGEKDKEVKAQIIQSKAFQNDLAEIQRDWMKNAEITPQHIYQGILMLLQGLIR